MSKEVIKRREIEKNEQGVWSVLTHEYDYWNTEGFKSERKLRQLCKKEYVETQIKQIPEDVEVLNSKIKDALSYKQQFDKRYAKGFLTKKYSKFKEDFEKKIKPLLILMKAEEDYKKLSVELTKLIDERDNQSESLEHFKELIKHY